MFKEFKEFISKGNAMDLAIGIIIGGAFQKIVTSLVSDIIMPCVSILIGKVDFADMAFTIGGASIKYGNFITTVVDFLIISFVIFLIVRYLNKLKEKSANNFNRLASHIDKLDKHGKLKKFRKNKKTEEAPEPETKICPYCLTEIKYKATRCPNCTSELSLETPSKGSTEES